MTVDFISAIKLEIKEPTETEKDAPYLELNLENDNKAGLKTKHYKR